MPGNRSATYPRSVSYQLDTAIRVTLRCDSSANKLYHDKVGSGVIISKKEIITAYHVVSCVNSYGYPIRENGKLIEAHSGSRSYALRVKSVDASLDVVELSIVDDNSFYDYVPAHDTPAVPAEGDIVCSVTSWPMADRLCGRVIESDSREIRFNIPTVPGNSGSPVYDDHGVLVAIVTRYCLDSHICGGVASNIGGPLHSWKLITDD